MINRSITCLILSFVVVLGIFNGNSLATDGAKPIELSTAIGQAKLFAELTEKEKTALEMAASLRHCQKGERIIEQGKSLDRMFIILEGQAGVRVNSKLVATLPEKSLVGEIGFLDMLPASADVTLLKESFVIELNNTALKSLMNKQPRIGYILMREIARIEAQRLRAMNKK